MNTKKRAIKTAVAVTVALVVLAPTAASAASTAWVSTDNLLESVDGCTIQGYNTSDRAVAWEKFGCSGDIGLRIRYTSGGSTYYSIATTWDPVIVTVNHSNVTGFRVYH